MLNYQKNKKENIMKKNVLKSFVLASVILASCASAPKGIKKNNEEKITEQIEKAVGIAKADSEETVFIKSLENVSFKLLSAPKFTTVGLAFKTAYSVSVSEKDGKTLAGFPVTVSFPAEKSDGKIIFATKNLTTDENGVCTFLPEKPAFACNAKIAFYPTPAFDSEAVLDAAKSKDVEADFKVRSDISQKGAVLFVWEFNERNRPTRNSYDVLSKLKGYGIWNVGNAPVNEPSDIGKSLQTLYRENYEIIEDSYGYLICGTIKFLKPVEPLEGGNGYSCTLVADISAINMKNGKVIYHQTDEQYSEVASWNNVYETCKGKLADKITEGLIYGL